MRENRRKNCLLVVDTFAYNEGRAPQRRDLGSKPNYRAFERRNARRRSDI